MTVYRQLQAMGTTMDLVIPHFDEEAIPMLMRDLREEMGLLESMLSNYLDDSEISCFNRLDPGREFHPGEVLANLLEELFQFTDLTKGLFDFTLGAWTSLPDRKDLGRDELTRFCRTPVKERISLENGILTRCSSETIIDSGGFGKGLALRSIERIIRNTGIQSAFISFGRSSVLAIGSHPQGDSWKVGIQHPGDLKQTIGVIELKDSTLSISGNSMNNRNKFGDGGHVMDPHTGRFNRSMDQVAVVSKDPLGAEVLSTAYFASLDQPEEEEISKIPGYEFYRYRMDE
jgi:thiamine biosynthesis lipoprotein